MAVYNVKLFLLLFTWKCILASNLDPIREGSEKVVNVMVDQMHHLDCLADATHVTWYHRKGHDIPEEPVIDQSSGSRTYVHKNGSLIFQRILLSDMGFYRCVGEDDQGDATSIKYSLKVFAPVEITTRPSSQIVKYGEKVILECQAIGWPAFSRWWRMWEPGRKSVTLEVIRDKSRKTYHEYRYTFNATKTYMYECVVENVINNTVITKTAPATVTVEVPPVKSTLAPTTTTQEPRLTSRCGVYNGSICKNYLGGRSVFLNMSESRVATEEVVKFLWSKLLPESPSKYCNRSRKLAEKLLCHYAFPDCTQTPWGVAIPLPICWEDCVAVNDVVCVDIFLGMRKKAEEMFGCRDHVVFPSSCAGLPSKKNGSFQCTDIQLLDPRPDLVRDDCYYEYERGRHYNGTVNVTETGLACQPWSSTNPQLHDRNPNVFADLPKHDNFCRNPGGEEAQPWCYTMGKERWQKCNITKCAVKSSDVFDIPQADDDDSTKMATAPLVIIAAVSSVAAVLLTVVVVMWYKMNRQTRTLAYTMAHHHADFSIDLDELPENCGYFRRPSAYFLNSKLEDLEYPRNEVIYLCDIGQGAFGRVFKARCPNIKKGEDRTLVAVKMLKSDATEEMQEDFEREASLMVEFDHTNIVKLLGVCAIGKPMCLLFEYMPNGDLTEFLRQCSPEHFIIRLRGSMGDYFDDTPKLDHMEQIHIAQQIANGMVYLSRQGYVHRDLATRNCLVGLNLSIKISDFGLAHKVPNEDYYRGEEGDAIPIRWMPIEAILFNRFSVESDIWSFGVVMWEIFTFALQPYYGMTHEQVVTFLQEGRTLSCPDNTPQEIYDLMCLCWSSKPSLRPPFSALYRSLNVIKETLINAKLQASVLR